jgi:hypothetical protein
MNQNPKKVAVAFLTVIALTFTIWSCKDDNETSLNELQKNRLAFVKDSINFADSIAKLELARKYQYFKDSLLLRDSLSRLNQAGQITYAVIVINGSTTSVGNGRLQNTQGETGVKVTVSQFGKTSSVTTDDTGIASFTGFFRSAAIVNVSKTGFTTASYIVQVAGNKGTPNDKNYVVGQLVPIFETTGTNTSTISGRATIQSDLTNATRELVPDGTSVTAAIDVDNYDIIGHYLGNYNDYQGNADWIYDLTDNDTDWDPTATFLTGYVVQASYSGLATGTVTGGNYSLVVPASADPSWGLPIEVKYSELGLDQSLFETLSSTAGGTNNVLTTYRTLFGSAQSGSYSSIPSAGSVNVTFESFTTVATANAVIRTTGEIDRINITNGGSGYVVAPEVVISAPTSLNDVRATATATITNGTVTGITITNPGTGYSTSPTVSFVNGGGATASTALLDNGTVTGVVLTNTGSGYTAAPTVTFSAPGGTGTTATGTATIDAQGRVTGVSITSGGTLYAAAPTVTFSAPTVGVTATGTSLWSGKSIGAITLGSGGANYLSAPVVTVAKPDLANGTQATATAVYDAGTRSVVAILVTNSGSGYTAAPTITISPAGTGAAAEVWLKGGPVISVDVTAQGAGYAYAPKVTFTGGGGIGATADAVMSNGKLVGITVTNGGTGYTSAPTLTLVSGSGALANASVAADGSISGLTLVSSGSNYSGTPRVVLTSSIGAGATATATVNASGAVTGLTLVTSGTGYVPGNRPNSTEFFGVTSGSYIYTNSGIKYVRDVHYGTGFRQPK